MSFKPIVAVLLALTLVSCKQDASRSDAVPPPHQQLSAKPKADDRKVIVAFGDSLTAGVVEHAYPEYLQQLLDQNHLPYRVDNQGVSGDTTTDGLARIDNVLSARPALVLLEFGGNDGLRGVPVPDIQANLQTMIERLQSAHIPTVLLGITLPGNYGQEYVSAFNSMYTALVKKDHLPLFPFLLLHVYQHRDLMQPDGIHPDSAGNRVVAQDVFDFIRPILKKQKQ